MPALSRASLHFDFAGAYGFGLQQVTGERDFTLLVTPGTRPADQNPSPWYAFRYEAEEQCSGKCNLTLSRRAPPTMQPKISRR